MYDHMNYEGNLLILSNCQSKRKNTTHEASEECVDMTNSMTSSSISLAAAANGHK